jgi:hypothetical protein
MLRKMEGGRRGRAGLALLLAAGLWATLCNAAPAQDREAHRGDHRREIYDNNHGYYAGYSHGYYGGPYKGYYPSNCATPYCGGGCHVYGDAPIYSAPADYGSHCALWCR